MVHVCWYFYFVDNVIVVVSLALPPYNYQVILVWYMPDVCENIFHVQFTTIKIENS